MPAKKMILRKEFFGGIFIDTASEKTEYLNPAGFESKKKKLEEIKKEGKRVKVFDVTESGLPLLHNAASSPMEIYFELTKKCNGLCNTCFMNANFSRRNAQEISFSEIESIVRQFSDIGGFYIRLTGGEPTMRHDFFDIVDLINEEGIVIGLNSNGLFGEGKLERILVRGIKDIRISLDGPEEVNDAIRGEGTYKRIEKNLGRIAEYNRSTDEPVKLTINVVLMKSNMDYIEQLIELAQDYDAKLSFGLLRPTGRAHRGEMLSPEEVVLSAYKAQQARKEFGLSRDRVRINYDIFCNDMEQNGYAPYPFDNSRCPIGSNGFALNAYGHIVPCGYLVNFKDWIGEDLRGRDLLELWHHSSVLTRARNIVRAGCESCRYHKVKCNSGCPVMAYIVEGNVHGQDPYCVKDVNILRVIQGKLA